ncbi:unnamed protein product [Urochloa humidicola]
MLPRTFRVGKRRRFLNVSTGKCIYVRIPDLRHYYFIGPTAEGLLVLCRKGTQVVQLLNPLTGQVTYLPCATTLLDPADNDWRSTGRGISYLPFRCAGLADDSTVALLNLSGFQKLAVAKPGDKSWTRLCFDDWIITAFPFRGRLYCATQKNILVVENAASNKQPQLLVVAGYELEGDERPSHYHRMFLVHDDHGDMILVHEYSKGGSNRYTAYRVKLDTGNVVPTSGLGGQTLFVSRNRSAFTASVPARVSSSISADTIYFCDYDNNDRPKIVAFDLFGTCSELNFDKKDIVRYLLSYVCS